MSTGVSLRITSRAWLVALVVGSTCAWGQSARRDPHIGYLYPAGGSTGSVIQVSVGGQFLKGPSQVLISGEGVRATVIRHVPPLNLAAKKLAKELQRRLKQPGDRRFPGMPGEMPGDMPGESASPEPGSSLAPPPAGGAGRPVPSASPMEGLAPPGVYQPPPPEDPAEAAMMEHPIIKDLGRMTPEELRYVTREFRKRNKGQRNAQIGETVLIEVTVDPGAPPGPRELRLLAQNGLTNPLTFQVGSLGETLEREPNDPDWPDIPRVELPALLNGQIMPGDVDCSRFQATRGSTLVIVAEARRLIPYLADAVPGWFQASLVLRDPEGREVAWSDDSGFDPDPAIRFEVPRDGVYRLEIHDALYRGRQDFVYRIAVDAPRSPVEGPREPAWVSPERWARVDSLPGCQEAEPNDDHQRARWITPPVIISGTIAQDEDVDVFRFQGRAGNTVVAEITARRRGSPLDSLLTLVDPAGRVLAQNDDHKEVNAGLLTHHADSYISARLPAEGVYFLRLSDAQHHGNPSSTYQLRVSAPRPDFVVLATPASLTLAAAPAVVVTLHAIRRDGFGGDIDVALAGAPPGFRLDGGRIPGGRDVVRATLYAPPGPFGVVGGAAPHTPQALRLEARAPVGGQAVRREVIPAEDVTQAFLYRHLLPSQELMVACKGGRRPGPPVAGMEPDPVRIPAGGTAEVFLRVPPRPLLRTLAYELQDPPKGLSLKSTRVDPRGLTLVLEAGSTAPPIGYADNLIVEVIREGPGPGAPRSPDLKKPGRPKGRVSLGVLPAIPFQIVGKN